MYGCLFVITGLSPGHLMLAPPAKHYGAAPNHHSTHGVGGGSHWQRLLVCGVVGGRVRGGHGHHQPQLLNDDLQVAPPAFPLAPQFLWQRLVRRATQNNNSQQAGKGGRRVGLEHECLIK